jgi:hypothetical protein
MLKAAFMMRVSSSCVPAIVPAGGSTQLDYWLRRARDAEGRAGSPHEISSAAGTSFEI